MRKLYYGWIIVVISFTTLALANGARHSFAVFYPAILSDFHWARGITATIISVNMLLTGFASPMAGALINKYGPRKLFSVGGGLIGIGLIACSTANAVWQFVIYFGIISAIGIALLGVAPHNAIISSWFTKKRGQAIGLAFAGAGLGFLIAALVQLAIDNFGWRMSYLLLGILIISTIIPLNITFQRFKPEEKRLFRYETKFKQTDEGTNSVSSKANEAISTDWNLGKVAKNYRFWSLSLSFLTIGMGFIGVVSHQVAFAVDMGFSPIAAASVFGVYGIASVAGHFLGFISDHWGRERAYTIAITCACLAIIILLQVIQHRYIWILYLYAILFGLGIGLCSPTLYSAVADIYDGKYLGLITGILFAGFSVGTAIGPAIAGYMYDTVGSYIQPFTIGVVVLCFSCVLMWISAPRKGKG